MRSNVLPTQLSTPVWLTVTVVPENIAIEGMEVPPLPQKATPAKQ